MGRIWYQRRLGRPHQFDEVHKAPLWIPLDVEFRADHLCQIQHILILDMPFVRPWMHGNALCTKSFSIERHLDEIGIIAASRIAQGRDLVNIYTEFGHFT